MRQKGPLVAFTNTELQGGPKNGAIFWATLYIEINSVVVFEIAEKSSDIRH